MNILWNTSPIGAVVVPYILVRSVNTLEWSLGTHDRPVVENLETHEGARAAGKFFTTLWLPVQGLVPATSLVRARRFISTRGTQVHHTATLAIANRHKVLAQH